MGMTGSTRDESKLNNFFATMIAELESKESVDPKRAFAINRLKVRMRKRARINRPDLATKAVEDFVKINDDVANIRISIPPDVVNNARHYITVMLERFNTRLSDLNIQEVLDREYLMDNWKFGPGASNGVSGSHAAEKIYQNMTCTSRCLPLVQLLRDRNLYFRLFDETQRKSGITLVGGSRLSTVLKNEETHRTIALEGSGNMALQLAAGTYLTDLLRYIGLDISCQQPKNKALACRGSLDNSIATIDLKNASDMQKIDLVRLLMPSKWYDLLTSIRSEFVTLPDGRIIELNMISTMGNGFTFPLMTLIIASLIYGYRATKGGPSLFIDWSSTCVFGDDIIIPSHEYDGFCEILSSAGFVINHDKSYSVGPFRESCGGDYYEGYDVTPFYVKSLSSDSAVYVAINQVFEWCARHNCLLHKTLTFLRSCLKREVYFVPEWHNPDEGILTSQVERRYKHLRVTLSRRRLSMPHYEMMLCVGGFISDQSPDRKSQNGYSMFYAPRLYKNVVRVRKSRLPHGYLDGSCPIKRDKTTTDYVQAYALLLFARAK